jgi:hypothetical protein
MAGCGSCGRDGAAYGTRAKSLNRHCKGTDLKRVPSMAPTDAPAASNPPFVRVPIPPALLINMAAFDPIATVPTIIALHKACKMQELEYTATEKAYSI